MTTTRWPRIAAPAALILCLVLAACGSSKDPSSSASASGSSSSGGIQLKVGEFSWTAAAVETEILASIAKEHPNLGVSSIKPVPVEPATGWVGIERGDIDVMPEVNLPNQQELANKAKSTVNLVSKTYGGAIQGWFVPAYAVQGPNAPAKGLTSITQLNKYASVFGDTLYDGAAGWLTTQQNTKRIKAFGLSLKHSMSSEAALIAQLVRAYSEKKPILVYSYQPQWIFKQYKLVQLKEPTPYHSGCFTGTDNACAIPTQEVWIAARKDLQQRAPKFYAMLTHVKIPLDEIDTMLNEVHQTSEQPSVAAAKWVSAHKSEIDQWVG